jgi:hypothetical protein
MTVSYDKEANTKHEKYCSIKQTNENDSSKQ